MGVIKSNGNNTRRVIRQSEEMKNNEMKTKLTDEEDEKVFHSNYPLTFFSIRFLVHGEDGTTNDHQNIDDDSRPPFSDYPFSIKSSSQN